MKELDPIVLTRAIPEHGLAAGDVGTIVHEYAGGSAFEVEFVRESGDTIAVLTLGATDVRPRGGAEILHARSLE